MSHTESHARDPRRGGRRAAPEPDGPAKVQGSTAAAILVLVAIVGFGIGAVFGNSSGDEPDRTAAEDEPPATPETSPDDGDGTTEDSSDDPAALPTVTLEMADSAPAGEELEYTVRTDPAQPGLELGVERRNPGQDWAPFGDPQLIVEIGDDGEKSGHVITGIAGEAEWRFVGEVGGQRVESNVVTATITEEDDNSGQGNGNGNGGGGDG